MARFYSPAEMERQYAPGDRISFSKGAAVMTAETADRFAFGLVEFDRETGKYRRAQSDHGQETMIINEAKFRERLLAGLSEQQKLGNRLR